VIISIAGLKDNPLAAEELRLALPVFKETLGKKISTALSLASPERE